MNMTSDAAVTARLSSAQPDDAIVQWLLLPEGERADLLDGRIVYKAMATIEHGDAIGGIWGQIYHLRGRPPGGGGWWLSENVKMYLADQGVQPDMVGWRTDRHPQPPRKANVGPRHLGVYVTPPDWICEVLSPSTSYRDKGAKWTAYHAVGVEHYWLVDLANEMLTVYRRNDRTYELLTKIGRDDTAALPPFESVELRGGLVFLMTAAIREG
jgi:Uma2 family endonuclease